MYLSSLFALALKTREGDDEQDRKLAAAIMIRGLAALTPRELAESMKFHHLDPRTMTIERYAEWCVSVSAKDIKASDLETWQKTMASQVEQTLTIPARRSFAEMAGEHEMPIEFTIEIYPAMQGLEIRFERSGPRLEDRKRLVLVIPYPERSVAHGPVKGTVARPAELHNFFRVVER